MPFSSAPSPFVFGSGSAVPTFGASAPAGGAFSLGAAPSKSSESAMEGRVVRKFKRPGTGRGRA